MPSEPNTDLEHLVERLEQQVAAERAQGGYADDLSDVELVAPAGTTDATEPRLAAGFDLGAAGPRVRFRPELGYSSKPFVGRPITLLKRFYLRLLFYVFDDLARQTDAALSRVESALAVEIATRERLQQEVHDLRTRLERLEDRPQR
jgi:hypothetical protein